MVKALWPVNLPNRALPAFPYRGSILWMSEAQRHELSTGPFDAPVEVEFEHQGLHRADRQAESGDKIVHSNGSDAERREQLFAITCRRRLVDEINFRQPVRLEKVRARRIGRGQGLDDVGGRGDEPGALL